MSKILLYTLIFLLITSPVQALTFNEYINSPITKETEATLRHSWKVHLGFDLFKPYYVAQAWKQSIKERFSVHLLGLRGTMDFEVLEQPFIEYKFTRRF